MVCPRLHLVNDVCASSRCVGARLRLAMTSTASRYRSLPFASFRACRIFQPIDLTWPRLQLVHERPFIFLVPGFFSSAECAALRSKAASSSALLPQGFDNTDARTTGARTSARALARHEI